MRARGVVVPALLAVVALSQPGCAANIAPPGWLPSAQEAQQEAYGAWMDMQVMGPGVTLPVRGELLAIGEDSVFTVSGDTVRATPIASVAHAKLEVYDPNEAPVAGLVLMGILATPTTGALLFLTAPAWVIVGTATSAVLSRGGKHRIDWEAPAGDAADADGSGAARKRWRELRLYARFPQGMPPGLDRTQLRERPRSDPAEPALPQERSISG